jgi:flagellar basal-body rod protein FlgG
MLQSLYAASSGMEASQTQFNAISNDLANMNTPGYQATDVGFESLLYSKGGASSGTNVATGAGAGATIVGRDQTEGPLQNTGRSLDVAINGPGYLQVRRPDGSIGLTRNGSLQVDSAGHLATQDGELLSPPLTIPGGLGSKNLSIAADGTVSADGKTVGKIGVVDVPAPNQLLPDGNSTFSPTAASGAPRPATGSQLQQGALEGSNVDINAVMSQMINAERGYQMAGQAVQYQDQMLQIANGIKPQ